MIRFYYYFLQTNAGLLFEHTNIEKQYKMFTTALKIILTHNADPTQLEDLLRSLVETHVKYGILTEHVNYFIDSFMKALAEIFSAESDHEIIKIWTKVISEIMFYFKNNM